MHIKTFTNGMGSRGNVSEEIMRNLILNSSISRCSKYTFLPSKFIDLHVMFNIGGS